MSASYNLDLQQPVNWKSMIERRILALPRQRDGTDLRQEKQSSGKGGAKVRERDGFTNGGRLEEEDNGGKGR